MEGEGKGGKYLVIEGEQKRRRKIRVGKVAKYLEKEIFVKMLLGYCHFIYLGNILLVLWKALEIPIRYIYVRKGKLVGFAAMHQFSKR